MKNYSHFSRKLLEWNDLYNEREMPWKGEKDPFKIWLSEIILQQTRVEQGISYYQKFVNQFSRICDLANAPDETVFKMWEGLGYYSRCRNLMATARYICYELNGKFPKKFSDIINLRGIGPYTAAAIASFAFNEPYAVVDGNVMRVITRYFGIFTPIDTVEGKKEISELAQKVLDKQQPGVYNQAIMDFGATVCKPALPLCLHCPLNNHCRAFQNNQIACLPVKTKKISQRNRWFYYIVAEWKGRFFVRCRTEKDIWQNLHEFYLIETNGETSILETDLFKAIAGESYQLKNYSTQYRQQLTHQKIFTTFIHIQPAKKPSLNDFKPLSPNEITQLAFPKTIADYIKKELLP